MERKLLRRIRVLIALVIFGLVLSGVTAFPLETELRWVSRILGATDTGTPDEYTGIVSWIVRVRNALTETNARYPFLAYGTDWLAFAHLVIAVVFLGPLIDPRRNVWILHAGIVACGGVILLALIAGEVRGIPVYWRMIDCSFGVFCAVPLLFATHYTRQLERSGSRDRI